MAALNDSLGFLDVLKGHIIEVNDFLSVPVANLNLFASDYYMQLSTTKQIKNGEILNKWLKGVNKIMKIWKKIIYFSLELQNYHQENYEDLYSLAELANKQVIKCRELFERLADAK